MNAEEEALERESRMRQEALAQATEAMHAALREERKAREREDLRIESRSQGLAPIKKGEDMNAEVMGYTLEQRSLRQGLAELQDRLAASETRQRNAEERTVSMLDAIM